MIKSARIFFGFVGLALIAFSFYDAHWGHDYSQACYHLIIGMGCVFL